jgi:NADPH-dependent glutamate synthase beta subunit-like oxidoreductase
MPKKEKFGKIIKMEGLKELPFGPISFGTMEWNETGNWRYVRPIYKVKVSPCVVDCPLGENIPRYMLKSAEGDFEEAWKMLIKDNPFPAVCGRLCDFPCEPVCLRKDFDENVGIRDVERFLGDMAAGKLTLTPPKIKKDERVAVMGAGPAGLTCAYYLARSGYKVKVFDAGKVAGGSLRNGNSRALLPSKILDGEIKNILSQGVEIELGTRIDDPKKLSGEYKALFIATGNHKDGLAKGSKEDPQATLKDFVKMKDGLVVVDEDGITSRESVFAGGGIVAGNLNIAEAIAWGKRVAKAIDGYIKGRVTVKVVKEKDMVLSENLNFDYFTKVERNRPEEKNSKEGDQGKLVETFDGKTASAEASRCFNCGICIFCDNCMIFCPDVAIEKVGRGYNIHYYHCKGCGVCVHECPRDAMSMESELKWKK